MNVPDYMHGRVNDILSSELLAADARSTAETRRSRWAVVLGLKPEQMSRRDNTLYWMLRWGDVLASGDTPEEAVEAFEVRMKARP